MATNRQIKIVLAESVSLFIYGVALASLFVWCMIQGIIIHLSGAAGLSAFPYYFIAWIAGVGGLALYWQAKNLFHYAEISK